MKSKINKIVNCIYILEREREREARSNPTYRQEVKIGKPIHHHKNTTNKTDKIGGQQQEHPEGLCSLLIMIPTCNGLCNLYSIPYKLT